MMFLLRPNTRYHPTIADGGRSEYEENHTKVTNYCDVYPENPIEPLQIAPLSIAFNTAPAAHRKRQPIERMIHDWALLGHFDYGLARSAGPLPVGAAGHGQ